MRKIIFNTVLFLMAATTIVSCQKISLTPAEAQTISNARLGNNTWMRYDESNCFNPWEFNWVSAPSDKQLAGAVMSFLRGAGINVLEIRTSRDEKMTTPCSGCNCPSGFHYFVRVVSKKDVADLELLNFYQVNVIPEIPVSESNW